MSDTIANYQKANKTSNAIIVIFISLIVIAGVSIYFFIFYKNSQESTSTEISGSGITTQSTISSSVRTYGNIFGDGQNNGYYNRFNGYTKNYFKDNGTSLTNSTVCVENNGFWDGNKCLCIAPFYGNRCQNQDFNQDFYEVHAKIYYDDGVAFQKNLLNINNVNFNNDFEIYNIYPGDKNPNTPSMLDYPYYGRYTWYTREPNGSINPPYQNFLTPTGYSIQDPNSKGVYIVKNDLIEKCYILRGIYVIQLLNVNDPEYDDYIVLMKKESQFDFAIYDQIIAIPDSFYTGMAFTPKPYFEYNNINLNCEFLDTAIDPIFQVNKALKDKKNIAFFPNPTIVMNGKFEYLKNHDGKRCPISTSQYPFGVMDTFQCKVGEKGQYPKNSVYTTASQLYTKLRDITSSRCDSQGKCEDINRCSTPKCDQSDSDTGDSQFGDSNLGGCLNEIRYLATNKSDIAENICRQKIPATNYSFPVNVKLYNGQEILKMMYYNIYKGDQKENTCANSKRCAYSARDEGNQGDAYGIVYVNYRSNQSVKGFLEECNKTGCCQNCLPKNDDGSLDFSIFEKYNAYDPEKTTFGREFWTANTNFFDKWKSYVVGEGGEWSGFNRNSSNPTPVDLNNIFIPCCKDADNCLFDVNKLQTFRKFQNFNFAFRDKSAKYLEDKFYNQRCYYDYSPYNLSYDNIHLNNFRPRGLDTYNISFYDYGFFFTNFYNFETPKKSYKMQSAVKIKLPEYTYIVNRPSEFNMNWDEFDNSVKWPKIFNDAMATETGTDLYGFLYMINQLVLPNDNRYYQSLGPLIPCSCRCANTVLSSSAQY